MSSSFLPSPFSQFNLHLSHLSSVPPSFSTTNYISCLSSVHTLYLYKESHLLEVFFATCHFLYNPFLYISHSFSLYLPLLFSTSPAPFLYISHCFSLHLPLLFSASPTPFLYISRSLLSAVIPPLACICSCFHLFYPLLPPSLIFTSLSPHLSSVPVYLNVSFNCVYQI